MAVDRSIKILHDIDETRFQESKDYFMKLIEGDLKLIAWMTWGLNDLFVDYTYEQMFEFIGNATEEDLKNIIAPVEYNITMAQTRSSVIFDKHFALSEIKKVTQYLNIENQIDTSPYKELEARGIVYVCGSLFWQVTHGVNNYADVVPSTGLWIFPNPPKYKKNTIDRLPCLLPKNLEEYKPVGGGKLQTMEIFQPKFKMVMKVVQVYLGNPSEITEEMLIKDSNSLENKQNYLLLLLDTMYGFGIEVSKRLEIAEKVFNLKGPAINEEVNAMEILQDSVLGEIYENAYDKASKQTKENDALALADYFIEESKGTLTWKEALERAKKVLARKVSNNPPVAS